MSLNIKVGTDYTTSLSLNKAKQWVHKRIKPHYAFKPKSGTEKPQYRCPFCGRMTHAERFQRLEIPNLDMSITFFGGYRGIKVVKHTPSTELRLSILEAVKEKLAWLNEKIGGETEWLKSKSAWIQAAPSISSWTTGAASKHLLAGAKPSLGAMKSTPSGALLFAKQQRQSK